MKKLLLIFSALALLASCKSDGGADLSVDTNTLAFDAKGTPQTIMVTTDRRTWRVDTEADWLLIEHAPDGGLTIGATSNPRKTERSAKMYISADGAYERVLITQAGSLHEIGEPYPADDPVGIIYMLTAGGEHGYVVSLDEMYCTWGPNTVATTGAMSLVDGRANTKAVVEAHGEESTFAADYPGFEWVSRLNGGDPDGPWFIPAYYQLIQMHQYMTGSDYVIPDPAPVPPSMTSQIFFTHADKLFRDRLNAMIVDMGGTPVTFTSGVYWSSTEVSASNADIFIFNDGRAYTSNSNTSQAKASQDWSQYPAIVYNPVNLRMRAVMEF